MSVGRAIVKRIIREFTENLPELLADTLASIAEQIGANKIAFKFDEENAEHSIKFYNDDKLLLTLEVKGADAKLLKKVKKVFLEE